MLSDTLLAYYASLSYGGHYIRSVMYNQLQIGRTTLDTLRPVCRFSWVTSPVPAASTEMPARSQRLSLMSTAAGVSAISVSSATHTGVAASKLNAYSRKMRTPMSPFYLMLSIRTPYPSRASVTVLSLKANCSPVSALKAFDSFVNLRAGASRLSFTSAR